MLVRSEFSAASASAVVPTGSSGTVLRGIFEYCQLDSVLPVKSESLLPVKVLCASASRIRVLVLSGLPAGCGPLVPARVNLPVDVAVCLALRNSIF